MTLAQFKAEIEERAIIGNGMKSCRISAFESPFGECYLVRLEVSPGVWGGFGFDWKIISALRSEDEMTEVIEQYLSEVEIACAPEKARAEGVNFRPIGAGGADGFSARSDAAIQTQIDAAREVVAIQAREMKEEADAAKAIPATVDASAPLPFGTSAPIAPKTSSAPTDDDCKGPSNGGPGYVTKEQAGLKRLEKYLDWRQKRREEYSRAATDIVNAKRAVGLFSVFAAANRQRASG